MQGYRERRKRKIEIEGGERGEERRESKRERER